MDFRRFSDPAFWAAALGCVLILFQFGTRQETSVKQPQGELDAVLSRLGALEESIKSSGISDIRSSLRELQTATKAGESRLNALDTAFNKLQQAIEASTESQLPSDSTNLELHTRAEAEKLIADLGKTPTSEQLAECLSEIDGWIVTLEDVDGFQNFKVLQTSALRQLVKTELADLHQKALKAETGIKAAELNARASQILALFPMASSKSVLDEARLLSSKHSEVGSRIEVIRRQRYNAWAISRIEDAIKAINEIASSFKTSDNPKTIEATVKHLGEVDPLLLEPVISQLYNYAIEQAKTNVTSEQQLEIGKRLIDPAIHRKGYGDF